MPMLLVLRCHCRRQSKGDPDGSLTGTASDIAVTDAKKGATIGDLVNQVGQNKIAINFVWTLVAGFLVMFMQAGCCHCGDRPVSGQECQPYHDDEFHGLRRRQLAYWLIGFAIQMGASARSRISVVLLR